jgi:spermidine synthase
MNRQSLQTVVALLFVFSGAVGLVYQIAWFKYLSLFLGNTTYAQTIVLATFMGGLAIGSAWWGRTADRTSEPLALYAWMELGIGLYCLLYPSLLEAVQYAFVSSATSLSLEPGSFGLLLLKLAASIFTLLFPTILMGGTLPTLVRFATGRIEESGRMVAALYFLNSLGAVVGTCLGGFFFIRILGLHTTMYATASVSVFIGVAVLILGRIRVIEGEEPADAETGPDRHYSVREARVAIAVAGLSGAAAMIYEVTWVRLLIPILGSSTYSFSLMLVGVIAGITLGSLIVTSLRPASIGRFRLLAWCQFAVAVTLLVGIPLYSRLPYVFWTVGHMLVRSDGTYGIFLVMQFVFCVMIVLLPTTFLGMSLPIAARIAARSVKGLGRTVGTVFAVNTVGTVVGSLLAGFVLIPLIGVKHAIEAGIAVNLAAGGFVLATDASLSARKKGVVGGLLAAGVIVYAVAVPAWGEGTMLSGVFRQVNANVAAPENYGQFREMADHMRVLYYREGASANVGVIEGESHGVLQRILIINGKADASSASDLPTQVLLGQLPMLLHPHPSSALVIGLGSGVTAGSVLRHPVERVDCVEISQEVLDASALFDSVSGAPLRDPRLTVTIEDATAFLNLTPHRYDVVISEPSNPWVAGVGNLYTTEFFNACKARMNRGGLMVQWFHLYEMDDDLFRLVLRTFRASFASVSVWQSMSSDVILVGSDESTAWDESRVKSLLARPAVASDLGRIGLADVACLLSMQIMSDASLSEYAGGGPLNSQFHPVLEYDAPRAFFVNRGVSSILKADERMNFGSSRSLLNARRLSGNLRDEELRAVGILHTGVNRGNMLLGYSVLRNYLERHPKDMEVLQSLADASDRLRRVEDQIDYLKDMSALRPHDMDLLAQYSWLRFTYERTRANALTGFDVEQFVLPIRRCIAAVRDTVDRYRVTLADMYYSVQAYRRAADQYARAIQIRGLYPGDAGIQDDVLLLQLARCLHQMGETQRALGYALQATQLNSRNREAVDFIYDIWVGGQRMRVDSAARGMTP